MTDPFPQPRPQAESPVVVQYCATFLKPEMLHIYRQITGLKLYKPVVFAQKRENEEKFPFADIRLFPKPRTHALRRIVQKQVKRSPIQIYPSEAARLRAGLASCGASLMHIYFGHIAVHLLPLLRERNGRPPVVVSFHGADAMVDLGKSNYLAATREMLGLADLVLARSESIAERLAAAGCDRGKLRIHRTGIPLGELQFRQRAAPPAEWRFVQACRLIPKKGLATSLRAFARFARYSPDSVFAIAGEGPMLEELTRLASELGVGGKVKFTGFLSQADLRKLYDESHVFLHPSELGADGNQEGVPNSMLEAMATGMPVLATRHGGIPEAVESSGILVAEGDEEALAQAMRDLALNPERYAGMSAAARREVSAKFELGAQVRALEGFYAEAINKR